MSTILTVVTVIAAISFGVGIFKLISHPTNGKIQNYYRNRYDDYHRKNFPPF